MASATSSSPTANALRYDCGAGDMQAVLNHSGSVLPALRYGMNLQMMQQQPHLPVEAPFRILTTCSWEQNDYTVKIYVPLQGVKTDLLRAVFQPDTLHIKAMNLQVSEVLYGVIIWNFWCCSPSVQVIASSCCLGTNWWSAPCAASFVSGMQGKNYIYSIKQTYRSVNPEGCSVIASKTKKNILITIAVRLTCFSNSVLHLSRGSLLGNVRYSPGLGTFLFVINLVSYISAAGQHHVLGKYGVMLAIYAWCQQLRFADCRKRKASRRRRSIGKIWRDEFHTISKLANMLTDWQATELGVHYIQTLSDTSDLCLSWRSNCCAHGCTNGHHVLWTRSGHDDHVRHVLPFRSVFSVLIWQASHRSCHLQSQHLAFITVSGALCVQRWFAPAYALAGISVQRSCWLSLVNLFSICQFCFSSQ